MIIQRKITLLRKHKKQIGLTQLESTKKKYFSSYMFLLFLLLQLFTFFKTLSLESTNEEFSSAFLLIKQDVPHNRLFHY